MTTKTDKQVVSGFHRPICKKCCRELRPETNGIGVLDMGVAQTEHGSEQFAYELWDADLWKCPGCGIEVVGGFGYNAISAHFRPDFQKMIDDYRKVGHLVVNNG